MLVLNIVGEEMISNLSRRGVGAGIGAQKMIGKIVGNSGNRHAF